MSKVHLLPADIISKIAAGEVIERPASVVKELVENSLDAHALSIEVELRQAGKTLIRVSDTGTGIEPDDLEKIFLRHSTSKLSTLNDLYRISSLGFRGEALYSIAAISDVVLRSKTKNQESGFEVHVRSDKRIGLKPVAFADGTEIEVKELFFNTPARKKFLKSDATEINQALNIFLPYTLIYPQVRFSLTHNERPLVDLAPQDSLRKRITQALNLESRDILEAEAEFPQQRIKIRALLGDMNIQRPGRDLQFIFINGRPVEARGISFHLNRIYRNILPPENNPFFALYLELPPENIDVNVHPAKRQVKIKNEYLLLSLLKPLCEETLFAHGQAQQAGTAIFNIPPASDEPQPALFEPAGFTQGSQAVLFQEHNFTPLPGEKDLPAAQHSTLKNSLRNAYYIGAFLNKYLFFETPQSFLVIDQHAAAERITYERIKKQIAEGRVEIEQLLAPIILKVTTQEMLAWEKTKESLEKLGFVTTAWDNQALAIHAYARLIKNPEFALRNVLAEEPRQDISLDTLARRACRQSIMAGERLTKEEAEYIRQQLLACTDPFTCPHGRPTTVEVSEETLSKQFLR